MTLTKERNLKEINRKTDTCASKQRCLALDEFNNARLAGRHDFCKFYLLLQHLNLLDAALKKCPIPANKPSSYVDLWFWRGKFMKKTLTEEMMLDIHKFFKGSNINRPAPNMSKNFVKCFHTNLKLYAKKDGTLYLKYV